MDYRRSSVVVISLVYLLAAAVTYCVQEAEGQQEQGRMQQKKVEIVLKEHTDSLMALSGVVGTAQGECAGKPCIKVFVVKKTPELLKQIPSAIEGYMVEVQETGEIRALDPS
ncbi:MAG: hypothetical protein ACE5KS_07625 [Woeseiaceae bacterium]